VAPILASAWYPSLHAAEPVWQSVEGSRFTLLTPEKPATAIEAATEIQHFINGLQHIIATEEARAPHLTIVLLNRSADFKPYRPLDPTGKVIEADAIFGREATWAVSVASQRWRDGENRRIIHLETASWLINTLDLADVPWMRRGLAEVASGYDVDGREHIWGAPVYAHIRPLRLIKPLSTERLVHVSEPEARRADYSTPSAGAVWNLASMGRFYTEGDLPQQFEPTAWLFVHYLLYGRHEIPRDALNTYLNQVRSGVEIPDAFRNAFLTDFKKMDEEIRYYVRHRAFNFYRAVPPPIPALTARRADPVVVATALARAALVARNLPLAETHLARVRELAPARPEAEELSGYLAKSRGDRAEMSAAFTRAAQLGSTDPGAVYWRARVAHEDWVKQGEAERSPAALRDIAELHKKAIVLWPEWPAPYEGLADLIARLPDLEMTDYAALLAGTERFPRLLSLKLGLAIGEARNGSRPHAIEQLRAIQEAAERRREPEIAESARTFLAQLTDERR
jgi:hypothetical protein